MNKYFYCYSYPLKKFLLDNNQVNIVAGIHPTTKKRYWVFEGNLELNNLLDKWKTRKH